MLLHVCYEDVRRGIIDLQTFACQTVESRDDPLGGVGDISSAGAEAKVDAAWDIQLA